jgi:hypothetical protein
MRAKNSSPRTVVWFVSKIRWTWRGEHAKSTAIVATPKSNSPQRALMILRARSKSL